MGRPLGDLARLFLRLGATAFGGPAVHIAMTRHEVVEQRGWLSDRDYLDVVAAANLLPGPNSTEVVMHVGARRAGRWGLVVAGVSFIVPATVIVLAVAWAYERYGTTDTLADIRYGLLPAVVAVVVDAVWKLGRVALDRHAHRPLRDGQLAAWLAGAHELVVLAGAALAAALWQVRRRLGRSAPAALLVAASLGRMPSVAADGPEAVGLLPLFWVFLRIGALLYGGGYVLVTFLEGELVDRLGWLTQSQLLDAVAVGQVTPGPLFTTATFVGYQVAGLAGAAVATVAIFLPAFALVAAMDPVVRWLRARPWAGAALDGLQAAAVGLIGAVVVRLAEEAFPDVATAVLGVAALLMLARFRPNPAWVILGGLAIGLGRALAG